MSEDLGGGPADTLVFQSHAATAPAWIRRCTATVRAWAAAAGYRYRPLGDELFAGIPPQAARKASSMLPLADMGRLMWAQRLLREHPRVVWVDSDVLVFAPERLALDPAAAEQTCREVLVERQAGGARLAVRIAANPTVLAFTRDSTLLPRWLAAMRAHAEASAGFGEADFGRAMLKRIAPRVDRAAIRGVGHFNAAVLKELYGEPPYGGPATALGRMASVLDAPLAAANLCGHHPLPPAVYDLVIDRLLAGALAGLRPAIAARSQPLAG